MNDLQKELTALKEKIANLESRIAAEPVAKWQPKGGYWQVDCEGDVVAVDSFSHQKEFGTKRITKEQAERAAVEMRRFNRLLALRDELCGDDGNWLAGRNNYWVYYDYEEDNYGFCSNSIMQTIGLVYFTSEQTVKRACEMLNSGEVEL